jgi:hypothetical protein
MIGSVDVPGFIAGCVFVGIGVLMLVYRDRLFRAMTESNRAFYRNLGGPLARFGDPPKGSRLFRANRGYNRVFITVFPLVWIGLSVWVTITSLNGE